MNVSGRSDSLRQGLVQAVGMVRNLECTLFAALGNVSSSAIGIHNIWMCVDELDQLPRNIRQHSIPSTVALRKPRPAELTWMAIPVSYH